MGIMKRRGRAISRAIGLHGPPGFTGEGSEDVIHVGTGGEGEVAVLPQPGKHTARDGTAVPLSQLRALLLLLSLLPSTSTPFAAAAATTAPATTRCCGGCKAAGAARLGLELGLSTGVGPGSGVEVDIEITSGGGVAVHSLLHFSNRSKLQCVVLL